MSRDNLDLLKGTFGLLLLKAVSAEARHGHDIMKWLRVVSDETFLVEEGALYPALHRLEKQGWITADWRTTANNRRAKYYSLTKRGLTELRSQEDRWNRYVQTVGKVLEAGSA